MHCVENSYSSVISMWRPSYSATMEHQAYWMRVHYIPLQYGDIKCNQMREAQKFMDLMESMLSTIQFLLDMANISALVTP